MQRQFRTIGQLVLATVIGVSAVSTAAAGEPTWFGENKARGAWLVGVKTGNMDHEGTDRDAATNRGILLGYMFNRPVMGNGTASIEFEMTDTSDDGTFGPDSDQATSGVWNVESKAIYLAYRTAGTVYFKGKIGGVIADITNTRDTGPTANDKVEESQASLGAGVGMRLGQHANLELEWASSIGINDISYLSLGAMVNF
jgi:hypothetical protein